MKVESEEIDEEMWEHHSRRIKLDRVWIFVRVRNYPLIVEESSCCENDLEDKKSIQSTRLIQKSTLFAGINDW